MYLVENKELNERNFGCDLKFRLKELKKLFFFLEQLKLTLRMDSNDSKVNTSLD